MSDFNLPELPAPTRYADRMRGLIDAYTENEVITIQREAYKAGMLKAAEIVADHYANTPLAEPLGGYRAIIAATKGDAE